jgi:signal transduction histidine kinase
MLVFGWIFLSSSIVMVYAGLTANYETLLHAQRKKIEDLFRVLFHDLANPLGRIAIGISIAKKHTPEGDAQRGLEIAKAASDSMLEITQNVRKMYAVSKGKANVDLTPTSLDSALSYVLKVYASELDRKQVKVHFDHEKIKHYYVEVEPVSFYNQVFGNIVSNAIKFSAVGGNIIVDASTTANGRVEVKVIDHGIGMPKVLQDQLFDINKKTSRAGTSGETGTGFGMHIMKSFVEMYGGEIFIESQERKENQNSGTTIKLSLKGELK